MSLFGSNLVFFKSITSTYPTRLSSRSTGITNPVVVSLFPRGTDISLILKYAIVPFDSINDL